MKRGPIQWLQNVLLGVDMTGNAALDGDVRQTISARTGYAQYRGKAWAKVAGPIINALMFNRHHCINAAESEGLITHEQAMKWKGEA